MIRRALLWLVILSAAAGCDDPPPPDLTPANVNITIRARPSCEKGLLDAYDTTCLKGLLFQVLSDSGGVVQRECVRLDRTFPNLQAFFGANEPLVRMGSLTSTGRVRFVLRGLHDVITGADGGSPDVCDTALDSRNWLFFGSSLAFDLSSLDGADAGTVNVTIPLDCRDCDRGCETLGTNTCAVSTPSYCVPANLDCTYPCSADDACFEATLTCDPNTGRCDVESGPPGETCDLCTAPTDCGPDYTCVGEQGATTGVCALPCPSNRCINGTRCNRLGNDLQIVTGDINGGT